MEWETLWSGFTQRTLYSAKRETANNTQLGKKSVYKILTMSITSITL